MKIKKINYILGILAIPYVGSVEGTNPYSSESYYSSSQMMKSPSTEMGDALETKPLISNTELQQKLKEADNELKQLKEVNERIQAELNKANEQLRPLYENLTSPQEILRFKNNMSKLVNIADPDGIYEEINKRLEEGSKARTDKQVAENRLQKATGYFNEIIEGFNKALSGTSNKTLQAIQFSHRFFDNERKCKEYTEELKKALNTMLADFSGKSRDLNDIWDSLGMKYNGVSTDDNIEFARKRLLEMEQTIKSLKEENDRLKSRHTEQNIERAKQQNINLNDRQAVLNDFYGRYSNLVKKYCTSPNRMELIKAFIKRAYPNYEVNNWSAATGLTGAGIQNIINYLEICMRGDDTWIYTNYQGILNSLKDVDWNKQ